jgi:hypothetical protein
MSRLILSRFSRSSKGKGLNRSVLPGDRPAPKVLQIATFSGARVMKHDYDRG